MPHWLLRVLVRIHRLAAQGAIDFTGKALKELQALDLELDERDAREIVSGLRAKDSAGIRLYLKLALRSVCVVVSFHQDLGDEQDA